MSLNCYRKKCHMCRSAKSYQKLNHSDTCTHPHTHTHIHTHKISDAVTTAVEKKITNFKQFIIQFLNDL